MYEQRFHRAPKLAGYHPFPQDGSTDNDNDDGNTDEDVIRSAVRAELEGTRDEIAEQIREEMSGESEERYTAMQDALKRIQEQLDGERKAEKDPADEDVTDLEKRLVEVEKAKEEMEEKLRLATTQQTQPASEDAVDYGGRIVSPQMVELARSFAAGSSEERALDSSTISSGGSLPAAALDAFLDFVVEQQVTLSMIRVLRTRNDQGHTDELRIGSRKLRKATEGTAPTVADSITVARRTWNVVETIWGEDLTQTLLEDAIEREGTEGHIARLLAVGWGNDHNDLLWNGDEADSDPFISINDGYLKKWQNSVDSDVNDSDLSTGVTDNSDALQKVLEDLPDKFLGRTDLAYWCSVGFAQNYAEEVSKRETQMGDDVLINGMPALRYFGRRVIPETHIKSASQRLLFTAMGNMFWVVRRLLRVDSEWQPRKRVIEYTLSARTDAEYATGEAVVNGTGVPTGIN